MVTLADSLKNASSPVHLCACTPVCPFADFPTLPAKPPYMIDRPVQKSKRIDELDLFRGFAILGIFMVNILVMNVSFLYRGEWEAEHIGWLQQASFFVLENLFYSKFFTIFSFLFGIGVAFQMQRARENGRFSTAFFLRRFVVLFLLGVAHILFIWAGDILHLYGALGLLLLVFFRLPPIGLVVSAVLVFAFPFYTPILESFMQWIGFDYAAPLAALSREEILELKHQGSYLSGVHLRLKEYAFVMSFVYSGIVPVAFTAMLLGGALVKAGWLNNLGEKIRQSTPYVLISLVILLIYRFTLLFYIVPNFKVEDGTPLSIFLVTLYQVSDLSISFGLLWLVGTLWRVRLMQRLLSPLRYVGRMALSNYILQSIIGYLIMRTFNGYEVFTPFECILIVLAVYTVQIFLSKWWLQSFRFGPLEWLWRCASYLKLLPLCRS